MNVTVKSVAQLTYRCERKTLNKDGIRSFALGNHRVLLVKKKMTDMKRRARTFNKLRNNLYVGE